MATITDLPYELLYHVIFLLVQSSVKAADFASIISVCRKFLSFAKDEQILKLVDFDIKMDVENIDQYQHVNGLLVKCSEAGNVAARFFLGKVILVSSSQLLLKEWQKAECDPHPCDHLTLWDLGYILFTNARAHNCRVDSFMTYFLPKEVFTSESSQTRLVHHQLVKLFLLNGSHHDLAEMSSYLKSYIRCFNSNTKEDSPLIESINDLVVRANGIRYFEDLLLDFNANRGLVCCEACLSDFSNYVEEIYSDLAEYRARTVRLFELNLG